MDHSRVTFIEKIFSAQEVAASGTAYSRIIDVGKVAGNASLQITLTGDGTGKFEWVGSNDEDAVVANFIELNGVSDIVTAFAKTTGPGSDGKHIYPFTISAVKKLAIKVTETGGANSITVTAILALQ